MKEPKVSIVIPVYNVELYLASCLSSCVKQTIDSFEIIVINDGSPDNSQHIIDEYVTNYPQIIKSIEIENGGLGNARNVGVQNASGEYIAFVDSDDIISYNFCEELYNLAKLHDADVVRCDYQRFSNLSSIFGDIHDGTVSSKFSSYIEKYGDVINELNRESQLLIWHIACTGIYRKRKLKEINFEFPKGVIEDPIMKVLFLESNKIALSNKALYYYRYRENSITGDLDFNTRKVALSRWMNNLEYYESKNKLHNSGIIDSFLFSSAAYGTIIYEVANNTASELKLKFESGDYNEFISVLNNVDPNIKKITIAHGIKAAFFKLVVMLFYKRNFRLSKCIISFMKLVDSCKTILVKTKRVVLHIIKKYAKDNFISLGRFVKRKPGETFYAYFRSLLSVKDNVVFLESYHYQNFNGNVYYLGKHFVDDGCKVYVASNSDFDMEFYDNTNVEVIKGRSVKYFKILATAKYIISNTSLPMSFEKKDGQIVVNTWHGTPLKTLGNDMLYDRYRFGNIQRTIGVSDMLFLSNEFTAETMLRTHSLSATLSDNTYVLPSPRNSIFFDKKSEQNVREELGLIDKKVVVYMPTWRGSVWKSKNINEFFNETAKQIANGLSDEYIVYCKFHSNNRGYELDESSKLKYFPSNYETYKFLNIADVLVTDYSSVMFDFAVKNRPIILYTPDLEEYTNDRGMYFDINEFDFHVKFEVENVIDEIIKNTAVNYSKVHKMFTSLDNIYGSQQVYNEIINFKKKNDTRKNNILFINSLHKNYVSDYLLNINYDSIMTFNSNLENNNKHLLDELTKEKEYYPFKFSKRKTLSEFICYKIYTTSLPLPIMLKTSSKYNKIISDMCKQIYSFVNINNYVLFGACTSYSMDLLINVESTLKTIYINESYFTVKNKRVENRIVQCLDKVDYILVLDKDKENKLLEEYKDKVVIIENLTENGKINLNILEEQQRLSR